MRKVSCPACGSRFKLKVRDVRAPQYKGCPACHTVLEYTWNSFTGVLSSIRVAGRSFQRG